MEAKSISVDLQIGLATIFLPMLWLQAIIIHDAAYAAAAGMREAGTEKCHHAACDDDQPGKFNCGSRRLNCIPNTHTDARSLDLHGNLLTSLIERSFSHYMHLQNLDLSMNEIKTIAPGAFTGLTNLTSLILKLNRLQALTSGAFTGAQRLQVLDISQNNITVVQPGTFTGLASLKRLLLQGNHIQVIDRGALFGLENLNYLALQNNQLRHINSRSFDGMGGLTTLWLGNNELTSLPDLTFLLPTLRDIWLSGNPITCDCRIEFLRKGIMENQGAITVHINHPVLCASPPELIGVDMRFLKIPLVCQKPTILRKYRFPVKVFQGQRAILPCNATGIPVPILTWVNPRGSTVASLHDATSIRVAQQTDGSLRITEAREEDTGNYTCHARNEQGTDLIQVALIVSRKPAGATTGSGDSSSLSTEQHESAKTDAPCIDDAQCRPENDGAFVCDSTAGIIVTALVTFSTTLSTALILFYVWYRRQMERWRPQIPKRLDKAHHREAADGEEACIEVSKPEARTLRKVINAITMPGYMYAKPARRPSHLTATTNSRTSSLRMNKVEDSVGGKHRVKYLAIGHLRSGTASKGSRETLDETSDYLPLTTCSSSSCGSSESTNRDSCESTDSTHLYENALVMIRDPNYTALDPATLRNKHKGFAML